MAGDSSTNELATRQPNTPAQTRNSRQDNSAVFGMQLSPRVCLQSIQLNQNHGLVDCSAHPHAR